MIFIYYIHFRFPATLRARCMVLQIIKSPEQSILCIALLKTVGGMTCMGGAMSFVAKDISERQEGAHLVAIMRITACSPNECHHTDACSGCTFPFQSSASRIYLFICSALDYWMMNVGEIPKLLHADWIARLQEFIWSYSKRVRSFRFVSSHIWRYGLQNRP